MSQKQVVTRPGGTIQVGYKPAQNIAAGGVQWTVPTGKEWEPKMLSADLTATATAGNRVLRVLITDGVSTLMVGPSSGNIAATQVGGYDIHFGGAISNTTVRRNRAGSASTNVQVNTSMPDIRLKAGWIINIDDISNIDNADQLEANFLVIEYEA